MRVASLLNPELTFYDLEGTSKKRVLEQIASEVSRIIPSIDANGLFDNLIAREKLGSTGIGEGVAIPHCRSQNCTQAIGTLVKLDQSIDFDAVDGQKVDLLFVLIVPENATQDHLDTLSNLAEMFNQQSFRNRLRQSGNQHELFDTAMEFAEALPAA